MGAVVLAVALLSGCGGGSGGSAPAPSVAASQPEPEPTTPPTSLSTGPAACTDGSADDFACDGISLASRLPLDAMGGTAGNDIWGWHDAQTGREYALMGMSNGTAFVDVTEPRNPVFLGRLPTATLASPWRDIKVHSNHAYIVADESGTHGMQVFDLTRLRDPAGSQTFAADVIYGDFETAHNLAINEETGFAYVVGSNTCQRGLHMVDLDMPNNPLFAGCHDEASTHDTQCVVYRGPDSEHHGRELCFSSNEDHVAIVDVTDKIAPLTLSSTDYPERAFVHQGWLTEDQALFLLGDELDELRLGVPTRTHVFDVSDVDAPEYLHAHELDTDATDHNLYVLGERVFAANYTSGLRVLRLVDPATGRLEEEAFFDTFPDGDGPDFDGAWSVYPYLPSGTIIVSDIQSGLFVLTMQ